MMVQIIMYRGVSWCFGTMLAPNGIVLRLTVSASYTNRRLLLLRDDEFLCLLFSRKDHCRFK